MNFQEKRQKINDAIKEVIQVNKFFIMARYGLKYDPCPLYYSEGIGNSYDMYLAGQLLGHLRTEYKNCEEILYALKNKNYICGVNDLGHYLGEFLSASKNIAIGGGYPDFMDQEYFELLFPEEKEKDFLEYTYPISLDNFLELAKKMIEYFHKKVEWIIIYEDEQGKVHLKKYDQDNKKIIDDK